MPRLDEVHYFYHENTISTIRSLSGVSFWQVDGSEWTAIAAVCRHEPTRHATTADPAQAQFASTQTPMRVILGSDQSKTLVSRLSVSSTSFAMSTEVLP